MQTPASFALESPLEKINIAATTAAKNSKSEFELAAIEWERAFFTLRVRSVNTPVEIAPRFIIFRSAKAWHELPATQIAGDRWEIRVNITNFANRRQFPWGNWELQVVQGNTRSRIAVPCDAVAELPAKSRSFLYDGDATVMLINFAVGDASPNLIIKAHQLFKRKRKPKGPYHWVRHKVMHTTGRTKRLSFKLVFNIAGLLHRKGKKRICFASDQRSQLEGNLKAIRDRMVTRGLNNDFSFAYSIRTQTMRSSGSGLKVAWNLGRSDTIILDDYFPLFDHFKLRKSQTLIQAWHAGSGFKNVGFARFGSPGSPRLNNSHRTYDYAICGSEQLRDTYAEVFGIEREAVIPTGLPRLDVFLNNEDSAGNRALFEQLYPEAFNKRVFLLAPTFRGAGPYDAHYNYEQLDFAAIYEALGEDSVLLVRQHHFISTPAPIPEQYRGRIIDASNYPDTNNLLHLVDCLITDYSSIIYEYSLLRRPIVFFAYDLEHYVATRGMHRDYHETAPGQVVTTCDELVEQLRDPLTTTAKLNRFLKNNFDSVDAHNTDRFIDWLLLDKMPEQLISTPPPGIRKWKTSR